MYTLNGLALFTDWLFLDLPPQTLKLVKNELSDSKNNFSNQDIMRFDKKLEVTDENSMPI